MKTKRLFIFLVLALCIVFAVRWSRANPVHETSDKDDLAIQEFESLENYLNDTHQTNALRQLDDILVNERAMQADVDLSRTVTILQALRDGKTNEVLRFLEIRLDAGIGDFGSQYRGLPVAYQKQISLKPLQRAWAYRLEYPSTERDAVWAEDMTNAFQILQGK